MEKRKVFWMEVHSKNLSALEKSLLKEGYELIRPLSREDHAEHLRLIEDADYIIVGGVKLTKDLLLAAKKLKLICKYGIGLDAIDMHAAEELNIPVARAAGCNAIPVAEHTIALMLSVDKMIPYCDKALRDGRWTKREMRDKCYMLNKKRIGLYGCGNVGKNVAKRLIGFDTEVVYYDLYRLPKEVEEDLHLTYVDAEELLRTSDVISIHTMLTKETFHLFDKEKFSMMKPDAILINTSRGPVINEADLIEALRTKQIRGAGLDVFEVEQPHDAASPLFTLENVVVTPHVADACIDNVPNVTRCVYENIYNYEEKNGFIMPANCALAKK